MIIFNWGLHDICPEKYAAISKSDYVDNIGKMYQKMAKMLKDDGRVIWQTTTPISPFNEGRTNHDVLSLNAAASRLWSETAHPPYINDLHAAMLGACRAFQPAGDDGTVPIPCYPNDCECPLQQPGNVHFNFQGNWVLAASVADAIRSVLKHDAAPVGKSK